MLTPEVFEKFRKMFHNALAEASNLQLEVLLNDVMLQQEYRKNRPKAYSQEFEEIIEKEFKDENRA